MPFTRKIDVSDPKHPLAKFQRVSVLTGSSDDYYLIGKKELAHRIERLTSQRTLNGRQQATLGQYLEARDALKQYYDAYKIP
jgi:hypothetical protein